MTVEDGSVVSERMTLSDYVDSRERSQTHVEDEAAYFPGM